VVDGLELCVVAAVRDVQLDRRMSGQIVARQPRTCHDVVRQFQAAPVVQSPHRPAASVGYY